MGNASLRTFFSSVVTEGAAWLVFYVMSRPLLSLPAPCTLRRGTALLGVLLLGMAAVAWGAENDRRNYELASDEAALTLRQLSAISGREILFAAEAVRGVRTNSLRGAYTPLEAVTRVLAGTALTVVQDAKTGALAVRRGKSPVASPVGPGEKRS